MFDDSCCEMVEKGHLMVLAEIAAKHGIRTYRGGELLYPVSEPREEVAEVKVPFELTFAAEERVGDEVRNRYLDHLAVMFAEGHLDQAEYDLRLTAMMAALTKKELDFITSDLPSPPETIELPDHTASSPSLITPIVGAGAAVGALFSQHLPPLTIILIGIIMFWVVMFCAAVAVRIVKKNPGSPVNH